MRNVNSSFFNGDCTRRLARNLRVELTRRQLLYPSVMFALVFAGVDCTVPDRLRSDDVVFDFGFARQGSAVSHVFSIANPGNEPRIISRISTSCNCTVVGLRDGSSIPPSGVLEIPVKVDLTGKSGIVSSNVALFFEGEHEPTVITMKGQVPYEHPPLVEFGRVLRGRNSTKSIRLTTFPGQPPIDIVKVQHKDPAIVYAYRRATDDPKVLVLDFTVTDKLNYGYFEIPFEMLTNDSELPERRIQLTGFVVPPVEVVPKEISFGYLRSDHNLTSREILVSSTYGKEIANLRIEATRDDCFTWSLSTVDSVSAKILVQLKDELPSHLPPGILKGEVTVHCEMEGQELEARVELFAMVPRNNEKGIPD